MHLLEQYKEKVIQYGNLSNEEKEKMRPELDALETLLDSQFKI